MGNYISELCSYCFKKKDANQEIKTEFRQSLDMLKKDSRATDGDYMLFVEDRGEEQIDRELILTEESCEDVEHVKIKTSNFVVKRGKSPEEQYEMVKELGSGTYGRVIKVIHKITGQERAMKMIPKSRVLQGIDSKTVEEEINILKILDHPNIMKIFEFYEDEDFFLLITEYCDQGDLVGKLVKLGTMNEIFVKFLMYQVITAVAYLHQKKIIHGDIKMENIMLYTTSTEAKRSITSLNLDIQEYERQRSKTAPSKKANRLGGNLRESFSEKAKMFCANMSNYEVKLIDFGCSKIFTKAGKSNISGVIGTSVYCSPEVIDNKYSEKCDEWACGVLMYILLSAMAPFEGESEDEIYAKIKKGTFSFDYPEFAKTSKHAKDLITKLLTYNPKERISAKDALSHPFFQENFNPREIFKDVSDISLLTSFKNLPSQTGKFQEAVLAYLAHNFANKNEVHKLRKLFRFLDQNSDGRISREELLIGYKDSGLPASEEDVEKIIQAVDSDKNGYIEYEEFLRVMLDKRILLCESNLRSAFEMFDEDHDEKIAWNDIEKIIFQGRKVEQHIKNDFLAQIKKNQEEEAISYEEFCQIITEGN